MKNILRVNLPLLTDFQPLDLETNKSKIENLIDENCHLNIFANDPLLTPYTKDLKYYDIFQNLDTKILSFVKSDENILFIEKIFSNNKFVLANKNGLSLIEKGEKRFYKLESMFSLCFFEYNDLFNYKNIEKINDTNILIITGEGFDLEKEKNEAISILKGISCLTKTLILFTFSNSSSTQDKVPIGFSGLIYFNDIYFGEKFDIDIDLIKRDKEDNFNIIEDFIELKEIFNVNNILIKRNPFEISKIEKMEIINRQKRAIINRMKRAKLEKLIVGISGGLDSTLALISCYEAIKEMKLPNNNLIAVTMPCFGTTKRTKSNAKILSSEFQCDFREINIKESVIRHFKDINHDIKNLNSCYENSQARERTQVLLDIANDENALNIGTGDLSEIALGWTTYNGDHMSNFAINSTIPKTLMRNIIREYAENQKNTKIKKCLIDILETPVSPELLPNNGDETNQKTEEILGPYEVYDFFIYYALYKKINPLKVLELASDNFKEIDKKDLKKYLKRLYQKYITQQFKRSCSVDAPKLTEVSFSPREGIIIPSDASYSIFFDILDDEKI